jgi:two-component system, chemotaxis family, protein-glutamate methylesterase/glutaminase
MSLAPRLPTAASGPSRTRVMVVDDSVVVRGLVARYVAEAGDFEVVASVANGRIAVEALERVEPDIVLLDLEMPEMDGLEALPLLLQRRPGLKVIVVSTLTPRSATLSFRSLALGAVDYLPKPQGRRTVTTSLDFRTELVRRLKAVAGSAGRRVYQPRRGDAERREAAAVSTAATPRCLLIGASTGGPKAVEEVLLGLGPALQRLPTLVVQHMPPTFTAVFADHLRDQLGLKACEPVQGQALVAGAVYIAPGGRHMGLAGDAGRPVVRLDDGPPLNFCRPAVDVLFSDAAVLFGAASLAVVLTGMGTDGSQGCRRLAEAGATVIAQDEASSIIWGMPGSVVKAGHAREVLPLEAIGAALRGYITGPTQ